MCEGEDSIDVVISQDSDSGTEREAKLDPLEGSHQGHNERLACLQRERQVIITMD